MSSTRTVSLNPTPRSNGFGGGFYGPSARPTAVGGAGFKSPGTSAVLPTGVPNSGIIEARNNSGTNVRIPYARLVPLQSRKNPRSRGNDKREVLVNGVPTLEYDGLKQGELAWILGRRFSFTQSSEAGTLYGANQAVEENRFNFQACGGLGYGVDRMQRLASTSWMLEMIKGKMSGVSIALHDIRLGTEYQAAMCSLINQHKNQLRTAHVLHCPDILYEQAEAYFNVAGKTRTTRINREVGERRISGVFCLETGPFLRGMQVETHNVSMDDLEKKGEVFPRNIGDMCVMSAIETEIRRRNLMDWTPDGVVLSKLESPSGDPHASMELDARSAQMFNVAVQGPAITTAWTTDVTEEERFRLQVQPMDKVFICLVADLSWVSAEPVESDAGIEASYKALNAYFVEKEKERKKQVSNVPNAIADMKAVQEEMRTRIFSNDVWTSPKTPYMVLLDELDVLKLAVETAIKNSEPTTDIEKKRETAEAKKSEIEEYKKFKLKTDEEWTWHSDGGGGFDLGILELLEKDQELFRSGKRIVQKAFLTNFRLMRSTSSHMSNYSRWDPRKDYSRCGLQFGRPKMEDRSEGFDRYHARSEYIVGAWCVGTVMDSAASRSTVGAQVRTSPSSMALNLNVNVEWWSSDKLYKHFMNRSGMTLMRNESKPQVADLTNITKPEFNPLKRKARDDFDDVDKDEMYT